MNDEFEFVIDEFEAGNLLFSGVAFAVFDEGDGTAWIDRFDRLSVLLPDEDAKRPATDDEKVACLAALNEDEATADKLHWTARDLCEEAGGDFGGHKAYLDEARSRWVNR